MNGELEVEQIRQLAQLAHQLLQVDTLPLSTDKSSSTSFASSSSLVSKRLTWLSLDGTSEQHWKPLLTVIRHALERLDSKSLADSTRLYRPVLTQLLFALRVLINTAADDDDVVAHTGTSAETNVLEDGTMASLLTRWFVISPDNCTTDVLRHRFHHVLPWCKLGPIQCWFREGQDRTFQMLLDWLSKQQHSHPTLLKEHGIYQFYRWALTPSTLHAPCHLARTQQLAIGKCNGWFGWHLFRPFLNFKACDRKLKRPHEPDRLHDSIDDTLPLKRLKGGNEDATGLSTAAVQSPDVKEIVQESSDPVIPKLHARSQSTPIVSTLPVDEKHVQLVALDQLIETRDPCFAGTVGRFLQQQMGAATIFDDLAAVDHCLSVACHTPWLQWKSKEQLIQSPPPPVLHFAPLRFRFILWIDRIVMQVPAKTETSSAGISIFMIQYLLHTLVYTLFSNDACDQPLFRQCVRLLHQIVFDPATRQRLTTADMVTPVDSHGHVSRLLVMCFVYVHVHRETMDEICLATGKSRQESLLIVWQWSWRLALLPDCMTLLESNNDVTKLNLCHVEDSSLTKALHLLLAIRGKQKRSQRLLIHSMQKWLFHEQVRSILVQFIGLMQKQVVWERECDIVFWKELKQLIGLVPRVLPRFVSARARSVTLDEKGLHVTWDFPTPSTPVQVDLDSFEGEQHVLDDQQHEKWTLILRESASFLIDSVHQQLVDGETQRIQEHIAGLERLLTHYVARSTCLERQLKQSIG